MTLPKRIDVMRVAKDNSGLIKIKSNGRILTEVRVDPTGNDLIYIRYTGGRINPKVMRVK
jgi:hypothetical protein